LLEPGEVGILASNRNFKASSALKREIAGSGWYQRPVGVEKVALGEGNGNAEEDKVMSNEEALDEIISQADSIIEEAEKGLFGESTTAAPEAEDDCQLTAILPGFPEKVEGEIVFCDADNITTDGIYPGKCTYQVNVSVEKMAEVCMENYDASFGSIAKEGDILGSGFNFGCGSWREQAATAILAKKIPMVVAGSFGNIFSRNSINDALMGLEVPRLVERLRQTFSSTAVEGNSAVEEPGLNKDSLDSHPRRNSRARKSRRC
jgi:homoaconitate hydratase